MDGHRVSRRGDVGSGRRTRGVGGVSSMEEAAGVNTSAQRAGEGGAHCRVPGKAAGGDRSRLDWEEGPLPGVTMEGA